MFMGKIFTSSINTFFDYGSISTGSSNKAKSSINEEDDELGEYDSYYKFLNLNRVIDPILNRDLPST